MKKFYRVFYYLALTVSILIPGYLLADDAEINVHTAEEHIIPGYARFANATHELNEKAQTLCKTTTEKNLEATKQAFQKSMDSWQAIQHIRFGPIEFSLRMNRIQLWPDKRSSVSKHLRKLIDKRDMLALETERFAKGSVAIQGFSALERLLYGEQLDASSLSSNHEEGHFRCALTMAITNNLATMGNRLEREWSQGADAYINFIATAADENAFYESDDEVSSTMLNNLYTELQVIVEQKLDRALDKSLDKARGTRAENWRSQRSLRNIEINLQSLEAFYGSGFAPRLQNKELDTRIESAFSSSLQAVKQVNIPLDKAVHDAQARTQVEALRNKVNTLKTLIGSELPEALGLPLGFNSLDGD